MNRNSTLIAAVVGGLLIAAAAIFVLNQRWATASKPPADHHEEANTSVIMSEARLRAAGIELQEARPATLRQTVQLNGILQPNQEALTQVTPRFPGVVRELAKRVGDVVEKNDVLGKIESNQSLTVYELRAPFAGTVIDRAASLGEFASEQKPAFVIADLSTVWADFAVPRRDVSRIQAGNAVEVSSDDGSPPVDAKLIYVAPIGSADTQTALARAALQNTGQRLRPGLFVTGRVRMSEQLATVAVKLTALQTWENRTVVFVRSGDKFEARDVELGNRDSENVEVLFGLLEGDVYAAKNSFIVKAELGKGAAAHEH